VLNSNEYLKHVSINGLYRGFIRWEILNLPVSSAADKRTKYYHNFYQSGKGSRAKVVYIHGDGSPSCPFEMDTCTNGKQEQKDSDTEYLTIRYAEKVPRVG
jgi:hypothetical protein